mmetsp:Transcript_5504/g.16379  ORF Transcript_5504/g.16379 Transcript_5504/m.16379 type:complete len:111 (-) Transcript_5504:148-480(-)
MFRTLFIFAMILLELVLAAERCNPAVQVCDVDEIEEEMAAASKRGYAFIQAKSSRQSAKARKIAHIQDSIVTHNEMVNEQVEKLAAKHGKSHVLHRRTMMTFTTDGESDI